MACLSLINDKLNDDKVLNTQGVEKTKKCIKSMRCTFDQDRPTVAKIAKTMESRDDNTRKHGNEVSLQKSKKMKILSLVCQA